MLFWSVFLFVVLRQYTAVDFRRAPNYTKCVSGSGARYSRYIPVSHHVSLDKFKLSPELFLNVFTKSSFQCIRSQVVKSMSSFNSRFLSLNLGPSLKSTSLINLNPSAKSLRFCARAQIGSHKDRSATTHTHTHTHTHTNTHMM